MDSGIKKSYVLVERTRSLEQREQYEDIAERGICPFCPEYLAEFHEAPILKEGLFWNISRSDWLYAGVRLQFIIIANQHAEKLADLPEGAGEEFLYLLKWAEKEYGIASGVLGFRFGEIKWNGASVDHLHCQLFVADPEAPNYKTPRFKMGPSEEELQRWKSQK